MTSDAAWKVWFDLYRRFAVHHAVVAEAAIAAGASFVNDVSAMRVDPRMAEVVELPEGGLAIRHCNCPIQDVAARTGLPCVNEQQMY